MALGHPITDAEALIVEAQALSDEIEHGLLAYASPAARDEWAAVRTRWLGGHLPTRDHDGGDDLAVTVGKVRRFREILKLATDSSRSET